MKLFVYLITLTLFTKAFAADPEMERLKPALDTITPDGLLAHIKMLSSDEFEGRAPGSKGEELSIKYISDQFAVHIVFQALGIRNLADDSAI